MRSVELHRHHIDWNHENNAATNVTLVCERCHAKLHKVGYLDPDELLALRAQVMARDPSRIGGEQGQGGLF